MTLSLDQLTGTTAIWYWYNPRDGSVYSTNTATCTGSTNLTKPTADDWVLVRDDQAAGYPSPVYTVALSAPVLLVSTSSISVTCLTNAFPVSTTFTIRNSGSAGTTLYYTNVDSETWMTNSVLTGSCVAETDTITVTFDSSIGVGTNTGTITVSSTNGVSGSPHVINVQFARQIASGLARIGYSPTSKSLTLPVGSPLTNSNYYITNSLYPNPVYLNTINSSDVRGRRSFRAVP